MLSVNTRGSRGICVDPQIPGGSDICNPKNIVYMYS